MGCSVIIAAYNEERNISDCIKSLLKQVQKPDEILVIDDGSTDNTAGIAKQFPVTVITTKNQERSLARNFGADKAKSEIILFAEADSVFSKDWIKEILKEFKKGADAVIDRRAVHKPKTYFQRCHDAYFTMRYSNYTPFSAWAFKKDIFLKLNGFDPRLKVAEDSDLGKRLLRKGYKIALAKKAFQYHKGEPKKLTILLRRAFLFNKEKASGYFFKHPEDFPQKRTFLGMLGLILFVFLIAVDLHFMIYFFILILTIFFIKIGIIENGFRETKKKYIIGLVFIKIMETFAGTAGLLLGKFSNKP